MLWGREYQNRVVDPLPGLVIFPITWGNLATYMQLERTNCIWILFLHCSRPGLPVLQMVLGHMFQILSVHSSFHLHNTPMRCVSGYSPMVPFKTKDSPGVFSKLGVLLR